MKSQNLGVVLAAAVALGASAHANAQTPESQWALGITGGTLGVGPEVSWRPSPKWGVRANATFLTVSRDERIDDIRYDGDLKLNSYGALLDWFPAGGGFRISAGARANQNEIDLTGSPDRNVLVGGNTYTPAQVGSLVGTVHTDDFAPMLTVGYGGTLGTGLTFTAEVGVMWQGEPTIDNLRATGPFASLAPFLVDIEREEQKIEDELDDYKLWPVAHIGVVYRF